MGRSRSREIRRLGPAGSGNGTATFDDPVEPGAYTVHVDVAGHSATAGTRDLVPEGEPCLHLHLYLGPGTLHAEHRSYDRCG